MSLSELVDLIDANVFDSTSVFFGDYSNYSENISKLPIGVFNLSESVNPLLHTLQTYDKFDNISADPFKDDLADLAGENFVTFSIFPTALDSLAGVQTMDLAVLHTLFLTGNEFFENSKKTKIIVSGGRIDDFETTEKLHKLLSFTNTGVKYISVAEATAECIIDSIGVDEGPFAVAFLGETETIVRDIYSKYLNNIAKNRGITNNVPIINQSISEKDEVGIPMIDAALISLLRSYRLSESTVPIKAIIIEQDIDDSQVELLQDIINHYRSIISTGINPYKSIIAEDVIFINPNKCAAIKCYETLREDGNLAYSITEQIVERFTYPSSF